jgi:hypothetical protein
MAVVSLWRVRRRNVSVWPARLLIVRPDCQNLYQLVASRLRPSLVPLAAASVPRVRSAEVAPNEGFDVVRASLSGMLTDGDRGAPLAVLDSAEIAESRWRRSRLRCYRPRYRQLASSSPLLPAYMTSQLRCIASLGRNLGRKSLLPAICAIWCSVLPITPVNGCDQEI